MGTCRSTNSLPTTHCWLCSKAIRRQEPVYKFTVLRPDGNVVRARRGEHNIRVDYKLSIAGDGFVYRGPNCGTWFLLTSNLQILSQASKQKWRSGSRWTSQFIQVREPAQVMGAFYSNYILNYIFLCKNGLAKWRNKFYLPTLTQIICLNLE